jgi:hypothetical protein
MVRKGVYGKFNDLMNNSQSVGSGAMVNRFCLEKVQFSDLVRLTSCLDRIIGFICDSRIGTFNA